MFPLLRLKYAVTDYLGSTPVCHDDSIPASTRCLTHARIR
ncbi:hypothetical protein BQ8420_24830 [Nocardiopsis sp. JB363]|nr:hypothetical protein BQ8420_24830 [Nocardiopsis sp. JB363]